MNKTLLCLSLLALVPLSSPPPAIAQQAAAPAASANLALGKKWVSSDVNASGWDRGLTDGTWRAEGMSVFATGNSATFPKTVTIDLETATPVGYVAVGVPHYGSTKTIAVSLSPDDATYTEVGRYAFSTKKAEQKVFNFAPVTARYVRLTYVDHHDETVGSFTNTYGFTSEVAVYAPGNPPVLPVIPSGPEASDVAAPKYGAEDKINASFLASHESFLKRGKEGKIGVLFLGDSITAGWRGGGKTVFQERYGAWDPANFGIGGDRTQHVLWRIDNGELDGISPKVVVLMIGTNNSGNSAEEITRGVKKVVSRIQEKLPETKILLLGIFPRSAKASDPIRAKLKEVNTELAKMDNGNKLRYLDIGDKFLDAEGNLPPEIMPDYLHPNAEGYRIWAEAMHPLLTEMMK